MRGCLTHPLILFILILLLVGFAGGPLGASFMGAKNPLGFLGAPRPSIQVAAEGILHIMHHKYEILSFYISNSMLTALLSSFILVILAWRATRRLRLIPRGLQSLFEMVIEWFSNLTQSVAGKEWGRKFLPLILTLFLFILVSNWLEIVPFIETVGVVERGFEVYFREISLGGLRIYYIPFGTSRVLAEGLIPFFRPPTADVNIPLAMAILGIFLVQYWGIRASGFLAYIKRFLNFSALLKGRIVEGIANLGSGLLEALSQGAQIISLTFRLFGNIFAGDVLIILLAFLLPLAWILPIYGLEIIIGLVQAFIFAMLILVFATLATAGHREGH